MSRRNSLVKSDSTLSAVSVEASSEHEKSPAYKLLLKQMGGFVGGVAKKTRGLATKTTGFAKRAFRAVTPKLLKKNDSDVLDFEEKEADVMFAGKVDKKEVNMDEAGFQAMVKEAAPDGMGLEQLASEEEDMRLELNNRIKADNRLRKELAELFDEDEAKLSPFKDAPICRGQETELLYTLCVKAVMMHSKVLGEMEHKLDIKLERLATAFCIPVEKARETEGMYSDVELYKEALKKELLRGLQRVISMPETDEEKKFDTDSEYKVWVTRRREQIINNLIVVENWKPLKQRHKAQEEAKQNKPKKKKKKKKKKKGWFFCCSGPEDVDEEANEPQASRSKPRTQSQAKLVREWEADALAMGSEEQLDMEDAYLKVMLALLQSENVSDEQERDLLVRCFLFTKPSDKLNQFKYLAPISLHTRSIIESFAFVYSLGAVSRRLTHLSVLSWNLYADREYFESVSDILADLEQDRQEVGMAWTRSQKRAYASRVFELLRWCAKCVSRYQFVFVDKDDALGECVALLDELWTAQEAVDSSELMKLKDEYSIRETYVDEALTLTALLKHLVKHAVRLSYVDLVDVTQLDANPFNRSESNINNHAVLDSVADMDGPGQEELLVDKIDTTEQLVSIFKACTEDIRLDEGRRSRFDLIPEFDFMESVAATYLLRTWTDAKLFLRAKCLDDEEIMMNRSLMSLYQEMGKFYRLASKHIQGMKESELQDWFGPFIDRWLDSRRQRFTEQYLTGIIKDEERLNWDPISANIHYTHSVVQIFKFLYPINEEFLRMPYSKKQIKKFAKAITDIVQDYVTQVARTLNEVLDKEDKKALTWGWKEDPDTPGALVPSIDHSVILRLNNVHVCKTKLFELLRDIDLEKAYRDVPKLMAEARQKTMRSFTFRAPPASKAPGLGAIVEDDSEDLSDEEEPELEDMVLASVLGCDEGFMLISQHIQRLTDRIAKGMGGFLTTRIKELVWHEPLDAVIEDIQVQEILDPMWEYLLAQLDNLTNMAIQASEPKRPLLYDPVFYALSSGLIRTLGEVFEYQIVYPRKKRWKDNLYKAQVIRVRVAMQLVVRFFEQEYSLPKAYVRTLNKEGTLTRVQTLASLLSHEDSTAVVIAQWEMAEAMAGEVDHHEDKLKEKEKEEYRIQTPPFLTRGQMFNILKFRAEREKDERAAKFVKDHEKGFFKRLFH